MNENIYKKLCEEMARRGGRYPGKDIPEFYALAEELFNKGQEYTVCHEFLSRSG